MTDRKEILKLKKVKKGRFKDNKLKEWEYEEKKRKKNWKDRNAWNKPMLNEANRPIGNNFILFDLCELDK